MISRIKHAQNYPGFQQSRFQFSLVSLLGRIKPDNSISRKTYIFLIRIFLIVYVTDKDEYLDIGVIDTMILKDSRFSPDKYWLFGLSVNNSSKSTISSKLTISDSCEKMKLRDLTHRTCSKLSWFPTIKIPIFTLISFRQD